MNTHQTQREIGETAGFKNAEGLFFNFIQETCSPQKDAEAIVQLGLKSETLLDVDSKLFELAEKLKNTKNERKPSYIIAQHEPYSDERRGYLQGLADAIMIHFNSRDRKVMKSLIDDSGVLRRILSTGGKSNGICTTNS